MRHFSRFQYRFRDNLILLNYTKNLQQYSFLQTQIDKLYEGNSKSISGLIKNFSEKVAKYQSELLQVQKHDFSQNDLRGIRTKTTNNQPKNTIIEHNQKLSWNKLQPVLGQLSVLYEQMQKYLYENLSKHNLRESVLALTSYNCMDIKIWQKVISFVIAHYKSSTLQDRVLFITSISEYMKKFQFSSSTEKRHAFKFMYPESYLVDLIEFRSFFKAIQNQNDFIKQSDSQEEERAKLHLFENVVYLIMKATKKSDMNIYSVRRFFQKRMPEMILIASRHKKSELHKSQLYHIYFIYSYVNVNNPKWFEKIEKYYFQSFKETMMANVLQKSPSESVTLKSKQVNKLLSIWKLNGRANHQIYQGAIKPFIIFLIKYNFQLSYFSNICLNLVTAGIKDYETIAQLVDKCQKFIKEDQLLHMLKHYLNVVNGNAHYHSDYAECKSIQNPKIVKYFQDRKVKIFSSCLDLVQDKRQKNQRRYEHRKVEKFWTDVVKKLFEPKYEVIENATFCNYEIDFLILTNKFPLAIQVEGGHYNKKEFNKGSIQSRNGDGSGGQVATTGKKEMRETVLKAYGMRVVKIHCEEKVSTYVMQSRNLQVCTKFLEQKILEQTGLSVNDI